MHRSLLTDYFLHGIAAAAPRNVLPSYLPDTAPSGRTIILGCGKAAAEMASVAVEHLVGRVSGCVVTRHGHSVAEPISGVQVIEARHPVPDRQSLDAGRLLMELAAEAGPDDRVLFLISGGGSALLCAPAPGIRFADKQAMTDHLVRSGAPISAINLVRRHLSQIKGGRLAAIAGARGAQLITYCISDVTNDEPALIASGPSIAAPFEPERALKVLAEAGWPVTDALSEAVRANAPPNAINHPVHMLATNGDAIDAIAERATADGWTVVDTGRALTGDAAEWGRAHAALAMDYASRPGRHLLLSGGELTVTNAPASGRGGPNLEYLAGFLSAVDPDAKICALAGDSDGIDGTQDNAGGYVEAGWGNEADVASSLSENRTYDLFAKLGGLIITGPTRTNVNDIRMIAVESSKP